jgi:hypothetical protein
MSQIKKSTQAQAQAQEDSQWERDSSQRSSSESGSSNENSDNDEIYPRHSEDSEDGQETLDLYEVTNQRVEQKYKEKYLADGLNVISEAGTSQEESNSDDGSPRDADWSDSENAEFLNGSRRRSNKIEMVSAKESGKTKGNQVAPIVIPGKIGLGLSNGDLSPGLANRIESPGKASKFGSGKLSTLKNIAQGRAEKRKLTGAKSNTSILSNRSPTLKKKTLLKGKTRKEIEDETGGRSDSENDFDEDQRIFLKLAERREILKKDIRGCCKFVFLPSNKGKKYWDNFLMLLICYVILVLPYKFSFVEEIYLGWDILDYIIDTIFLIDLFLEFFTAYRDDEDKIIICRKKIACRY